jgi:hypothetical protein
MTIDAKAVELFNTHQFETKKQFEFLAKTVFLIGGGALTLSINLFLGQEAPHVPCELIILLKTSWSALFLSITCIVLSLTIMLIRDYVFGEKWRAAMNNKKADTSSMQNMHSTYDNWIIGFGIVSLIFFLIGLGGLAWTTSSLLVMN